MFRNPSFFVSAASDLFAAKPLSAKDGAPPTEFESSPLLAGAFYEFLLLKHLPTLLTLPVYRPRITTRWLQRMATIAVRYEMEKQGVQHTHGEWLKRIAELLSIPR